MKKNEDFLINNQVIKPGEHKQVILNTYQLPTKTNIEIPIYIHRSENPGPTLFLSAGMHGDEINGIEIVRKIISRKELKSLKKGNVIAIPVINIVSFLFGSRDLPDGRDLNRCFPGNKNGSLGSRIAYDVMKQIIPLIDFGIDFHTGGSQINNFPQLRCVFEFKDNQDLAERFSPPLIIASKYREGTLRKESAKKGKPILVFEGGESNRFDYQSINEGVNGCLRLMKSYDMLEIEIPSNPSVRLADAGWVRAKTSGLFHLSKPNGSFVNKEDLLGVICNPYGEIEVKLYSPTDGYIIGTNNMPVVHTGDALIHIGTPL